MKRLAESFLSAQLRHHLCEVILVSQKRSFFFPRGVEKAKGVFIGNFPAASEGDSDDFYNKVPFLNHDVSVADAAVFLQKYDVGCVPVLNRSTKELVGMFSERDIARAVAAMSFGKPPLPDLPADTTPVGAQSHHKVTPPKTVLGSAQQDTLCSSSPLTLDFHQLKVDDIMSKKVISIAQGTSLSEALMIMDQNNFRHLPVVSQQNAKLIVGLVSMRDIMHRHVQGEGKATTEDFMQWVLKMSS